MEAAELEYQQQFETKKKKVPKGTSTYQAAWLDDDDDEADEDEDEEGSDNEDMVFFFMLFSNQRVSKFN